MTGAGVPAGANRPTQKSASKPGKPDSLAVGTSGSAGERRGPEMESGRRRPARICVSAEVMPVNMKSVSPAAVATTPGVLPL